MLSLWAYLFNLILKRFGLSQVALWVGIVISPFAFGASHAATVMFIYGLKSFSEIPLALTVEILLVAAARVHFWADVVWHVIYGLVR